MRKVLALKGKMLKIILIAAAFFFILGNVGAQQYSILGHTVEITVDNSGYGDISEKFALSFPNETQLENFKTKSQELGVDLANWEAFDSRIFAHIGRGKFTIKSSTVSFDDKSKFLDIHYTLTDPIMEKTDETSRVITYRLKTNAFTTFDVGNFWEIPANTVIRFELPNSVEVAQPVSPAAAVTNNVVVWEGYKISNDLKLQYNFFKEIAPSFDLSAFILNLTSTSFFMPLMAVILVALGVVYWKRATLSEKIENYIVRHSEIKTKEEEHPEIYD